MEGKTTLIYVIGALSAAQMAIAATVDAMTGMHQASQRALARMDELAVAHLKHQCCTCPDLPPALYTECGALPEMQWPEFSRRVLELALLPREVPKLGEMEPRPYHAPQPFRGYMNGRDTRRKRW